MITKQLNSNNLGICPANGWTNCADAVCTITFASVPGIIDVVLICAGTDCTNSELKYRST